jgi:hypothetical protein
VSACLRPHAARYAGRMHPDVDPCRLGPGTDDVALSGRTITLEQYRTERNR